MWHPSLRTTLTVRGLAAVVVLGLLATAPAHAQLLQGTVRDAANEQPVVAALVKLVDADGVQRAADITGDDGRYRLEVPTPGEYVIDAEALGYRPYRSTTFETTGIPGVFPVDLLMEPAPVALRGLRADVDRLERMANEIRLLVGRDVSSLRNPPLGWSQIRDGWEKGWDLADLLRNGALPGISVQGGQDVCVELRGRCLPVFLNGMPVPGDLIRDVPLQMLEVAVVVQPNESLRYDRGGILLFTTHWIR